METLSKKLNPPNLVVFDLMSHPVVDHPFPLFSRFLLGLLLLLPLGLLRGLLGGLVLLDQLLDLVGRQDPDLGLVALPLQRAQLDLVRGELCHVQRLAERLIKIIIN